MSIYFAQAGDGGPIKIGFTGRPMAERAAQLKSSNHEPIKVLAVIEGSRSDEEVLHARFAAHRRTGEWFSPHASLLRFVATLPAYDGRRTYAPTKAWRKLSSRAKFSAERIWTDLRIPSDKLASEKIGLNRTTLRLNLGPSGRKIMAESAACNGARGGTAKGRNARKSRMPKADAAKIWHSNPGMTNADLLAIINADKRFEPYTEATAYRHLKKRQAIAGRRANV